MRHGNQDGKRMAEGAEGEREGEKAEGHRGEENEAETIERMRDAEEKEAKSRRRGKKRST